METPFSSMETIVRALTPDESVFSIARAPVDSMTPGLFVTSITPDVSWITDEKSDIPPYVEMYIEKFDTRRILHSNLQVGVSNSPVDQLPEIPQPSGWGVGHTSEFDNLVLTVPVIGSGTTTIDLLYSLMVMQQDELFDKLEIGNKIIPRSGDVYVMLPGNLGNSYKIHEIAEPQFRAAIDSAQRKGQVSYHLRTPEVSYKLEHDDRMIGSIDIRVQGKGGREVLDLSTGKMNSVDGVMQFISQMDIGMSEFCDAANTERFKRIREIRSALGYDNLPNLHTSPFKEPYCRDPEKQRFMPKLKS